MYLHSVHAWVIILPAAAPSSPYRRQSLATPGRSRAFGLSLVCLFLFVCGRADVLMCWMLYVRSMYVLRSCRGNAGKQAGKSAAGLGNDR